MTAPPSQPPLRRWRQALSFTLVLLSVAATTAPGARGGAHEPSPRTTHPPKVTRPPAVQTLALGGGTVGPRRMKNNAARTRNGPVGTTPG
ncbi:MAG: hypothetical protein P8M11_07630 [Planctomycetota bacterium]|nr:hypothetical protein [Planctomycetota bacterium]